MQDDEESIKDDISDAKEELKNATTKLNKFNKTKKMMREKNCREKNYRNTLKN